MWDERIEIAIVFRHLSLTHLLRQFVRSSTTEVFVDIHAGRSRANAEQLLPLFRRYRTGIAHFEALLVQQC